MSALAPVIFIYQDAGALSRAAAEQFVELSEKAIAATSRFTVSLSGGSTPRQMYLDLAADEFRDRVNWSRVFFFWGDERAVPPDDPQSNFRMANEALLSRVPIPPDNIYRIPAEKSPESAAGEYEQTLKRFWNGSLVGFDLILLGLGTNGHTASLFPHSSALREQTRWCVPVRVEELDADRITLTAHVLNRGSTVAFLVSGKDKSEVLYEVLRGPHDPERLPAQLIGPDPGKLIWLVDSEAASELSRTR